MNERNDSEIKAKVLLGVFLLFFLALSLLNITKAIWEYSSFVETLLMVTGLACFLVGFIQILRKHIKYGLFIVLFGFAYIMSSVAI